MQSLQQCQGVVAGIAAVEVINNSSKAAAIATFAVVAAEQFTEFLAVLYWQS